MGKKKFATDVIWSILALVLMNGALQLIVYPVLNGHLGEAAFGEALYVLGILAVFAPTIGLATNNIRLVESRTAKVKNGDYLLAMLPQIVLFGGIFVLLCSRYLKDAAEYLLAFLLLMLTTLRYYGDVDYRMKLDYKGYFLYYCAITAGYTTGVWLYPITGSWMLCFLLGEAAAWILAVWRGSTYRPLERSEHFSNVNKKIITLAGSYLLYNAVLNLDRVLLQYLIDSSMVTVYYVASLLGKTMALLVGPLNGVLIGYLTRDNAVKINSKRYGSIAGIFLLVSAVLFGIILLVMPIFVRLLYPNIVEPVMEIAAIANLSQIVCFSSSLLLTIMLTFASTKWQLVIQVIYAGVFLGLSIFLTGMRGVHGFTMASLVANGLRFVLTTWIGLVLLHLEKKRVKRGCAP